MSVDTTIEQYRATKEAMQSIIDKHMQEAFSEIREKFGATPVYVGIDVREVQTLGERYPSGVYAGCEARLGGD